HASPGIGIADGRLFELVELMVVEPAPVAVRAVVYLDASVVLDEKVNRTTGTQHVPSLPDVRSRRAGFRPAGQRRGQGRPAAGATPPVRGRGDGRCGRCSAPRTAPIAR